MLGFFKVGSALAAAGLIVAVGLEGCGPATGTSCSGDLHTVLGSTGNTVATCTTGEACVVNSGVSGCATCDPNQCVKGDQCITGYNSYDDAVKADAAILTTECRLPCNAQSDCPFDYHCMAGGAVADNPQVNYCVPDRVPSFLGQPFTPASKGEAAAGAPWGVACDPTKGFDSNSDCDTSQSFWCYGTSPTDANSYCTQFQCNDDGDCPGGWWCATINDSPSVTAAKRTDWGTTISVCMPRVYNTTPGTYCANCQNDIDCPTNDGAAQHCVAADGASATEKVCAAECQTDANCPLDQTCAAVNGTNVCIPRAKTCKGDGSFCAPCHSDNDCSANGGYCVQGSYSTEHYCTAPTPTCTYNSTSGFSDTCPALPANAQTCGGTSDACTSTPPLTTTEGVGCSYDSSTGIPLKQCYAADIFGLGCWTYKCLPTPANCQASGSCNGCYVDGDCCSLNCATDANSETGKACH